MRTMQLKLVWAALLSLGGLFSGEVLAASLEISPVAVSLAPGRNATTVEVRNRGGASVALQIRAYAWTQAGNADVLVPTQDIILSPPIFTVPANGSQTIRLLLRGAKRTGGERSYRLLLDEVPPANAKDQQIVIAMRVSLPVIVASASPAAGALQWRARRGPGNRILLSALNKGNGHDRVSGIVVTLPDGTHPATTSEGKNSYILAGAERHWTIEDGGARANKLLLNLTTRTGKSEQTLVVAP